MNLVVKRFSSASEFLGRAEDSLLAHEAAHNLILGICANLIGRPGFFGETPPYLATVEDRNKVVMTAIMTPPHRVVLSLVEPDSLRPRALAAVAGDLRSDHARLPGVLGPSVVSREFSEQWRAISGQAWSPGMKERIYQLETVTPVPGVSGRLRRASEADRPRLRTWIVAFTEESMGEDEPLDPDRWVDGMVSMPNRGVFLWEDGVPVSMVGFGGPTRHGVRIGPVYTPPEHRRHGYASAATAAVSQWILDSGRRFCFLFTDLANPTSNRIYQAIGYRPVCDVDVYRFAAPASTGTKSSEPR